MQLFKKNNMGRYNESGAFFGIVLGFKQVLIKFGQGLHYQTLSYCHQLEKIEES